MKALRTFPMFLRQKQRETNYQGPGPNYRVLIVGLRCILSRADSDQGLMQFLSSIPWMVPSAPGEVMAFRGLVQL